MNNQGISCNNCYKWLTQKEADKYGILWQHSGDMYCNKCIKKYGWHKEKDTIHKIVLKLS